MKFRRRVCRGLRISHRENMIPYPHQTQTWAEEGRNLFEYLAWYPNCIIRRLNHHTTESYVGEVNIYEANQIANLREKFEPPDHCRDRKYRGPSNCPLSSAWWQHLARWSARFPIKQIDQTGSFCRHIWRPSLLGCHAFSSCRLPGLSLTYSLEVRGQDYLKQLIVGPR